MFFHRFHGLLVSIEDLCVSLRFGYEVVSCSGVFLPETICEKGVRLHSHFLKLVQKDSVSSNDDDSKNCEKMVNGLSV